MAKALNLDGLIAAAVTPFTAGGREVDLDWAAGHIDWMRGFGITGVLTLGTNGEGPSVGLDERRGLISAVKAACRGIGGGLDVFAGATCVSLPDTIRAANDALEAGADAVALLPPYFFKDVDARGMADWFGAVIESLPAEGRGVLYNMPAHAKIEIADEVVRALIERFPDQVVGIKDSSGDADRARRYLDLVPETGPGSEFRVMAGSDRAHAALYAAGCIGGVSGLANAVPALVKTIQFAHREGGKPERPQAQLNELHAILDGFPRLGALKQLIAFTSGLPPTHARAPYRDLTGPETAALERAVGQYLLGESAAG